MDKNTILDDIFASDTLGVLDIKVKNPVVTADDRLIASFEEINSFYETHKREPSNSTDMNERGLRSRLHGIRENPEKRAALQKYDRFKLLSYDVTEIEINTIDDIFASDSMGIFESDEEDIFTLKNVPTLEQSRAEADMVARREKCDDFETYEHLFIACQEDLKSGKRDIVDSIESKLDVGVFCVLDGILLYIADIEAPKRGNSGKINRRTTLIFENGTQSNMLLRSLGKRLRDSGKMITELEERVMDKLKGITHNDISRGHIYVLKSLSGDDRISTKKDLYKIGFSTVPVKERVKNAVNEPTYLMAPVHVLRDIEVFNYDAQHLEGLLHKFFGNSCLDVTIADENGELHRPREWFFAPLAVIDEAIKLIINREIVKYRYDSVNEDIVSR